jgi:NAD(P)-dependent dehydrogenase (short-subunit alcohol dehydrogenase family)
MEIRAMERYPMTKKVSGKADRASPTEVEQLVSDVAKRFGRLGILVNNAGVAAGGIVGAQRVKHALQRFGRPEEIAAGLAFLASREASFKIGTVLTIDGGFTA